MESQVSHDHHTVPKLYLRGFCGTKGQDRNVIVARHRDGGEERLTIKQATVEIDFYTASGGTISDDAVERWFGSEVENPIGELMVKLRKGELPGSASARETLSMFVAVQMVRTVAFRNLMQGLSFHLGPLLFANKVLGRAMAVDASLKLAGQDLTALHAEIARRAPDAVRQSSKESMMRSMVREANRLKPLLRAMAWILTSSDKPMLLTGDTPVVAVSGTGEILYTPMLLPELHEIQLPITPHSLLTITPFHALAPNETLTKEQANIVNRAIVRACSNTVLRRPDMAWPMDLVLPSRRTPLATPTVKVTASDGQAVTAPAWPPVIDRAFAEALQLLGGDPSL